MQELEQITGQVGHHVLGQVVGQRRAAACQHGALHRLAQVALEGDGQQLQADGPAVGEFVGGVHGIQVHLLVELRPEESQRLTKIEGQLRAIHLVHLALRTQAPQLQVRRNA
ncbi:hypothetical protein D3C78_1368720 [compost metagenome]